MSAGKKVSFSLTAVVIKDKQERGFTAYFAEFPEAIADGSSLEDAHSNLIDAFKIMLESRRLENYSIDKSIGGITQQNIDFELAV